MASSLCLLCLVAVVTMTPANAGGRRQGVLQWKEEGSSEKSPADAYQANSVHDPVLKLNQNIFHGNVVNGGDRVNNWMVLYCPYWWEPCQQISPHFENFAASFQDKLNKDLMMSQVRFARVDCATEKPLCNHFGVQDYPTVQHFKDGQLEKTWTSRKQVDPEGLSKFLKKQLAHRRDSAESEPKTQLNLADYLMPGDRALDVLLVAALAVSFWGMSKSTNRWHRSSEKQHLSVVDEAPVPLSTSWTAGKAADLRRPREHAPQKDGVASLMPQEWLSQPQAASLGMEL